MACDLTGREWRVFVALLHQVALFDRTEDSVSNRQLEEITGLEARNLRRALARLAELGVIEREPGVGRGHASRVKLSTGPLERGVVGDPPLRSRKGGQNAHKRGSPVTRIREVPDIDPYSVRQDDHGRLWIAE